MALRCGSATGRRRASTGRELQAVFVQPLRWATDTDCVSTGFCVQANQRVAVERYLQRHAGKALHGKHFGDEFNTIGNAQTADQVIPDVQFLWRIGRECPTSIRMPLYR